MAWHKQFRNSALRQEGLACLASCSTFFDQRSSFGTYHWPHPQAHYTELPRIERAYLTPVDPAERYHDFMSALSGLIE